MNHHTALPRASRISFVLTLALVFAVSPRRPLAEPQPAFPLWPTGAPGAVGTEPADIPMLTPYPAPAEKSSGATVIVCPGGGYRGLAPHEGEPIALWLNEIGVNAFVLKYRLAPRYQHPTMLNDIQRAIRTVRARAAEWKLDPARVGVLGFSAGGHLVTSAGTHFDDGAPDAADPIERVGCRPDLVIAIYPVVTMRDFGHSGSRAALLGENPAPELVKLMSNEEQVTEKTSPMFIIHGADDAAVPARNALELASALDRARVPYELHIFEHGRHGFGLGRGVEGEPDWTDLGQKWLGRRGFLKLNP